MGGGDGRLAVAPVGEQRLSGLSVVLPVTEHHFTAELWLWDARQQDTWTFVTLPPDVSSAVEDEADGLGPRAGFGSVRVEVRIGPSTWRTSLFPDKASGCFVLPVKRAVRKANGVEEGDPVEVSLRLL